MSDKLCPACYTELEVPAFIKPADNAKDEECGSAFRLKCGHAFHLECMCRSLRTSPGCPLCRDEIKERQLIEFTIDANGNIVDDNVLPEDQFNLETNIQISNNLNVVSKIRRVQVVRQNLNKAKKEYRRFEELLKKRRSEMLDQVFTKFRDEHKERYNEAREKFNKYLRKLKHIESTEIKKLMPEFDIGPHNIDKYVSYKLTDILSDSFGPQKRHFWRN
jgi:hypothetical protein